MRLNFSLLRFLAGIIVFSLLACHKKTDCSVYANEIYTGKKVDSSELLIAMKSRDKLLRVFDETPVCGLDHPCYQLLYYPSFGHGRAVRMEKKDGRFFVTVKCVSVDGKFPDCQNSQTEIYENEWVDFENMLSEFSSWQVDQLDNRKDAMDSSIYILEGNRPEGQDCDKKSYQFLARHRLGYDNVDALYMRIIKYQEDAMMARKGW